MEDKTEKTPDAIFKTKDGITFVEIKLSEEVERAMENFLKNYKKDKILCP
ncbi:hypothetical protein J4404_03045 [Candidatus Woesearchaeota archaeon]|nr:hypothetical protein [Candidatus Woesearchaeota archaeon]